MLSCHLQPVPDSRPCGIRRTAVVLLAWIASHFVTASAGAALQPAIRESSPPVRHWAFEPITAPEVPSSPKENPIDTLVRATLKAAGLKPSPEADRRTLLRRLSIDLLGLPPSPDEVRAFEADRRPDALEHLVDRLLASPHFGERWGRHWLDLARYADSDGYEKDNPRPDAYLYRDWVIEAINRDLPFDQFTIEQLAGDLLAEATDRQRVATGFHRQTLLNKEGGVDQEEYRCKATVDRTHTTGAVWLGLTLGCAECHSHKYDPISQREFYQMYAFFNDATDTSLPLPTEAERAAHEVAMKKWKATVAGIEQKIETWSRAATNGAAAAALSQLQEDLAKARKAEPKLGGKAAMVLAAQPRPTHVHLRGDFLQKGEPVQPGTPAFLPALRPRATIPDRLDLARWLVAPGNPLTARVTVNQVWRQLFGRGLVATENDFGLRGERPSHPELLDWLAREFQRLGWSRKQLIRRIVTSHTYRQSSAWRDDLAEQDPLNTLLARQARFRVDAEVVRDTALAASGLLNRRLGGPSFKPPLPPDLANLNYANGLKWDPAKGDAAFRRGLYIHFQRTVPYPMLMAFDAPESTVTCTRRMRSNSPLQALTLLNNELFIDCARALAGQLAGDPSTNGAPLTPERLIRTGFERVTSRAPGRAETRRLMEFWKRQHALFAANPGAAREAIATARTPDAGPPDAIAVERATAVALSRVLLNLDESITRE